MWNPNKWPKKYRFLLMFIAFILFFFLNHNRAHATEAPNSIQESYGQQQIKNAMVDTLAAVVSFIGAAESVAIGNVGVGIALTLLSATEADKALTETKNAWNYYFPEPEQNNNFEPENSYFQRD